MTYKVIIVDDHPIVIDGLRLHIETQPDLVVVGESGDGLEVEALVNHLHPDVLVLDLACLLYTSDAADDSIRV